jgi:hypothetical protein
MPTNDYYEDIYHWRTEMIDGQGRSGDCSVVTDFAKKYPVVFLKVPTHGCTLTGTPTSIWTQEDGVIPYGHGTASCRPAMSRNETLSPLCDAAKINNTRYAPTEVYALGHTY